MATLKSVMSQLKKKGSAQTRKIYANHGAPDDLFGVKVADMKVIAKSIKGEQELALELFETGNGDAQYLAGMVADGSVMTKKQLEAWAKNATWYMVSEYAVPGVVTESDHARDLANKWMKSRTEHVAACGWTTYSGIVATRPDEDLDLPEVKAKLQQIESGLPTAKNRVRYAMNGFIISVGGYIKPLTKTAIATAKKVGKVHVDMGGTACKVPDAIEYIAKMEKSGRIGKKRKTTKC